MSSSLALYFSFKIRFLETFPSRLKDLVWHLLQGTSHGYKPFHISTEILFPLFSVLGCNFLSRRVLDSYFFYSKLKVFDSIVFWVLLFLRRNVCLLHWGPFLIASASLNVFLLSPVASSSRIMWLVRLSLFLILMALRHDVCCQFCAIPRHCLFKYCLPTVLFLFSFWNSHCSGIKPLGIFAQTSLHVAFQSSVLTCPVSDR